jgi:hypothetical protein
MPSKESSEAQPLVYHPNYGLTIALVVFIVTIFFVIAVNSFFNLVLPLQKMFGPSNHY